MKVRKTITSILSYVIMGIAVLILAFSIYMKKMGEITFIANRSILWVLTNSMEPDIEARSYILIEKVAPEDVREGDVIAFYSDDPQILDMLNTHRVIGIIGDHAEFVTKGDYNVTKDAYTAKADRVVGRYVSNVPFLTVIGRILSGRNGLIMVLFVLFAILMAIFLPEMKRLAKEAKKEEIDAKQAEIDRRVQEEVQRMLEEKNSNPPIEETGEETQGSSDGHS